MKQILFVCVHNAGRSQMAEAFFNRIARERGLEAVGVSAGTAPGGEVNPVAVQAMEEFGISMEGQRPKLLTAEMAAQAERVITMGCGVEASMCPAGTYISEDWGLADPKGQSLEGVRAVRDQIRDRIDELVDALGERR